jgi:hypothetical protein
MCITFESAHFHEIQQGCHAVEGDLCPSLRLKFKFCLMTTTHEPFHFRQTKFGTVKNHGHNHKICLYYYIV